MAAEGRETKNYGKGEMQKTPMFTNNIDALDGFDIVGDRGRGEIMSLMKNAMSLATSVASPSSKMRRGTKKINEIIQNFIEERASRVKGSMSTAGLDILIKTYEKRGRKYAIPWSGT